MSQTAGRDELLSVGALHAFVYCPRLFYFEEVERVRVADAAVLAGRSLHVVQKTAPAAKLEPEVSNWARPYMESDELGIHGTADLLRHRDGGMIVHELKRGRSAWDGDTRAVWDTDRLQVGAYALLAERHLGVDVREARVRYAADNVTVRVAVDADLRQEVLECIAQARALRNGLERPPVTSQERKCHRCSLASVCLPEEARLSAEPRYRLLRLLPPHPRGESVHVTEAGARVGRSGDCLRVELRKGSRQTLPIAQVGSLTLHGMAQVSTQALRLCADRDVPVHWVTAGGGLVGSLAPSAASGHRHMRQFEALREPARRLELSKILVRARLSSQLRYLLRAPQKRGRTMIAVSSPQSGEHFGSSMTSPSSTCSEVTKEPPQPRISARCPNYAGKPFPPPYDLPGAVADPRRTALASYSTMATGCCTEKSSRRFWQWGCTRR